MFAPFTFFCLQFLAFKPLHALSLSNIFPPPGSVIVNINATPSLGDSEFPTISSAVNSLPNDDSPQVIFIFPGVYVEQVNITRPGPVTIYGYTTDTTTFTSNTVLITSSISAASVAGSDDLSGTLRVHKNDFNMYNINVTNGFGKGSQALAISQYGDRVGLYACAFSGFQDTVLAEQGRQVYLAGYIQGATDFIFGQRGQAYFEGNVLAVSAAGFITASGRDSNDNTSFVFNLNTVVNAPGASGFDGKVFLGRPWFPFAKVIFKNTFITTVMNSTLWSIWSAATPNTATAFFADYNTTGSGVANLNRAPFAILLNDTQADSFSIESAVGSDFATWVDTSYLISA